jgi:hypothetical protein
VPVISHFLKKSGPGVPADVILLYLDDDETNFIDEEVSTVELEAITPPSVGD